MPTKLSMLNVKGCITLIINVLRNKCRFERHYNTQNWLFFTLPSVKTTHNLHLGGL